MSERAIRRSAQQWRNLVAEQARSELSANVFCRSRGIAYSSFMYWRKRLSLDVDDDTGASMPPSFVELTPTSAVESQCITNAGPGESTSDVLRWRLAFRLGGWLSLTVSRSL